MKQKIDYKGFDTLIQPTEWRYAAAAHGLWKYLQFTSVKHQKLRYMLLSELQENDEPLPPQAVQGFDGIIYHSEDITEERYLDFTESYFEPEMTHLSILRILSQDSYTDDDIKQVNDYVKSKTVLKNLFAKTKFDGTNSQFYADTINANRQKIIKEIYRYSLLMYKGFSNTNLLLTDSNNHCRLQGYTVDEGRKTRYIGYSFDKDSFVGDDIIEFDFIPFAFTKTYESYFVNNNFNIHTLNQTNTLFADDISNIQDKSPRTKMYTALKNSGDYLSYDVEIIIKPRDKEQYETLFVRAEKLKILKELRIENLRFNYKINDDYYFSLENEVYEKCLNDEFLDSTIEFMLKISADDDRQANIIKIQTDKIIKINERWKKILETAEIKKAKTSGYYVSKKFIDDKNQNKLDSYKKKLISAIVAHDYIRMNEILLSLSSYIGTELSFAYALFEDPEKNIGLAFAFANSLSTNINDNIPEKGNE